MRLSVIVPAYREGEEAALQIHRLSRHPRVFEVIAAWFDCPPSFTRILRRIPKVKMVLTPKKGRGLQMNLGAAAAQGDLLLFLHADSWVEPGGIEELVETMRQMDWVGGAFRLKFNHASWRYRLKSWSAHLRSQALGMSYGDQGYFVRRTVFDRLGGFPNLPLFEDVGFFDRLKKQGPWILLKSKVVTSVRRFERQGYWKATLKNVIWILLFKMGVPADWLAKRY